MTKYQNIVKQLEIIVFLWELPEAPSFLFFFNKSRNFWNTKKFKLISEDEIMIFVERRWSPVKGDGLRWKEMVSGERRWSLVKGDGLRWKENVFSKRSRSPMKKGFLWWKEVVSNERRWSPMKGGGLRWKEVVTDERSRYVFDKKGGLRWKERARFPENLCSENYGISKPRGLGNYIINYSKIDAF